MNIIKNGGTIWGDQLAKFVKEQGFTEPVYYEIGAFNGKDVDVFREVLPQTQAYAFEADPKTFMNYLREKPYGTFMVSIGNKTGNEYFYQYNDPQTNSLRKRTDGQSFTKIETSLFRLDDFIQFVKIPYPDVIKIDTEGCTYEVLEGMEDILKRASILYLETENEPVWKGQKLHSQVAKLLGDFECVLLHDNGNQNDSLWLHK